MPYRKEEFINGEVYHIISKGLDNNLIFKDESDYYRGIFSIYEFNNAEPVNIKDRRVARATEKSQEQNSGKLKEDERDRLVDILCFCFMPNHIHLLLKQIKDGGITKFMNKFGAGYPSYFYEKYNLKGKGYFFQGRFKSVLIKNDEQLKTIFVYIHANPLDFTMPQWRDGKISDWVKASTFLKNYKWSSLGLYTGAINVAKEIKSLISVEFPATFLAEWGGIEAGIHDWSARDFDEFRNSFFED